MHPIAVMLSYALTLSRTIFQQDEIGYFPGLDGSDLRIDFERSCVAGRGGSKNLYERQAGLLELLHLQVAVQPGQI
jgi:hypothetical protein